jgi:hypothetical protein
MTMLGDGRLIIIDSKNKCIKIFKPDWYDFTSKKQLTDEPRGISFISRHEIVVTFAEKSLVISVSPGAAHDFSMSKFPLYKFRSRIPSGCGTWKEKYIFESLLTR